MIPGEIEAKKLKNSLVDGIELSDIVVNDMAEAGKNYGVEIDFL